MGVTVVEVAGPAVVSRAAWLEAQQEQLVVEKELTRERDAVSAARRELPWLEVTEAYEFDGPEGARSLAELFDGRSQLLVYHFMLESGAARYNFGTQAAMGDESPGISALRRTEDGRILLTYQTFSRGLELVNGAYHWLDLTSKGRDEDGLEWTMQWLQRHDAYGD